MTVSGVESGEAVLPAYAGMIPQNSLGDLQETGAPRVCGDDPVRVIEASTALVCSPRMRG